MPGTGVVCAVVCGNTALLFVPCRVEEGGEVGVRGNKYSVIIGTTVVDCTWVFFVAWLWAVAVNVVGMVVVIDVGESVKVGTGVFVGEGVTVGFGVFLLAGCAVGSLVVD